MAATMHDVAKLAGVSVKTVSNVVNDYPHVRPATRERVELAIAELGYVPNLTARSLRSGRSGAIGLGLPDLALAYFAELAGAIIAEAEAVDLVVLVEQTGGDRRRELALLESPRLQMTDGLIFSPLGMGQDDAELLAVRYPLVLLGERIFDGPVDHVTMQNIAAARAATEHLIDHGRRRLAVLGVHPGEVIGSAGLRLRGFREALAARGINFDESLVAPAGEWHRQSGADAMRKLLASGVEFDGVFAMNDTLALGGMRVLQEHGYRVPDDVAVVGFDNVDEGRYTVPSLSTVDPGVPWIAKRAVASLVERIERGADAGEPRQLLADFEVIERESTRVAVGAQPRRPG